jgi:hypothetical protein
LKFFAKPLGFTERRFRSPLVVPETRLANGSIQLG